MSLKASVDSPPLIKPCILLVNRITLWAARRAVDKHSKMEYLGIAIVDATISIQ